MSSVQSPPPKPRVNEAGQVINEFTGQEAFRDSIGTLKADGSRNWIMPAKTSGKFTTARHIVAVFLLIILFAGPFVSIDGHPLLLLNVLERKFVILGQPFWPHDFYLFVLAVISTVIFIVLFTVIFGRIFCGWVCPQTIFMEFVFRKIEQMIEGSGAKQQAFQRQPYNADKIIRKTVKHVIFFGISLLIANTFLAYLVGKDQLFKLIEETPANHIGSFMALVAFTGAFYFVFAKFREQVCIIACPYGRLQGVLLDNNSVVVAYDFVRGEPRGKASNKKTGSETSAPVQLAPQDKIVGDCVDCRLCVQVCPTAIDIRNGTQLECINCTSCIDACNGIMQKLGREKGLIRYASHNEIVKGEKFKFTTRMTAYSSVLGLLISVFFSTLFLRSEIETTILRVPGSLYSLTGQDTVNNVYQFQLTNKTAHLNKIEIITPLEGAVITRLGGSNLIELKPEQELKGLLLVKVPRKSLTGVKTKLELQFWNRVTGYQVDRDKTFFMGPAK